MRHHRTLPVEKPMTKYTLGPTEVVLMPEQSAVRGRNSSCDLVLTNLNLIVINKGIFGNSPFSNPKSIDTYPVKEIKIYNGQAQAQLTTSRGAGALKIYFRHGEEEFRFVDGGTRKIQKWIAKINEAATGQPAVEPVPSAVPAADRVVGILKDTLGAFKSMRVPTIATPAPPTPVATRCEACGAPMSGMRGSVVTCAYCDSSQHL